MNLRTSLILLAQAVILVFCNASLQAAQLIPMGHVELLSAYSEIKKGKTGTGEDLSGYFAPNVKFNDTLFLIPLLNVQLQRIEQFLPQEEGNRFYDTYFVTNLILALRKEFSPGWFAKVSALGTWNFVRESHEEAWGRGLYDYRDAGCAVQLKRQFKNEDSQKDFAFGFEYYRRQYPNFLTLISSTSVTPAERREKDYDGYKYSTEFNYANGDGIKLYLKPYYVFKPYIDKHLVLEDGTLDPKRKRKDYELSIDAGFSIPLPFEGFSFSLDNNLTHNYSNAGYYDSMNTVLLTDDVYTQHYYSYDSFEVGPSFEYVFPLAEQKVIRTRLGYSYEHKRFNKRLAQFEDSTYSDKNEVDENFNYFASIMFPLTKKINFISRFSYTQARSTQKYETYYRYEYDVYNVKAGFSADF